MKASHGIGDGCRDWSLGGTCQRGNTTEFLPFTESLAVSRSFQLTNTNKCRAWGKSALRPPNVPCRPDRTYENAGWAGWHNWLGKGDPTSKTTER